MIGDECRLELVDQLAQALQVAVAERIGRADREADAVQAERVLAAGAAQEAERQAAAPEVVLGMDLDEADVGLGLEELAAVLGPEADAGGERQRGARGAVRSGGVHGRGLGDVSCRILGIVVRAGAAVIEM